jgi:hypothetical protein
MAVGLLKMFGIDLPFNFNSPYKARNIIEFWRRWHMTLSRFLRDYLYIPLGGNRHGPVRRHVNLLTTMILGGLWQVVTREAELAAAGPAGITVVIKKAIEAGWVTTVLLLMLLNVYLWRFNLFPLPPLDGARLAFLGYELVTRRRANPQVEATVFMIGVLILIPVLIMVTVGDCRRMF